MTANPIEGGCLCGAVRYRITGSIDSVGHCHCSMCRRGSGGTVVTWATVPLENLSVTRGEPAVYKSSDHGERRFCPNCGTQIVFWTTRFPEEIDITVATLDHPEDFPPDRHIWTRDRLPWLHLDEHLPEHADFTFGS